MDSNQIGFIVLTFIQTQFPGGTLEFSKQGGLTCIVPFKENNVLIYHPEPPKEFLDAVDEMNRESIIKINVVEDKNFEDIHPAKASMLLADIAKDLIDKYNLPTMLFNTNNPLILAILIPESAILSKEVICDIASTLTERFPSIVRGIIRTGGEAYPFSSDGVFEVSDGEENIIPKKSTSSVQSSSSADKPERAITDDALTDLKIFLETSEDVLDFINKL